MAITLASNFDINAALPIDSRFTVADITARDAIAAGVRYEGLTVHVLSTSANWQLQGGITNGDWVDISVSGGASSSGGVQNFITDGDAEAAASSIFTPYEELSNLSRPTDGTGGTPAVTTSITTTTPLAGTTSFLLTKPAFDVQGEGWSVPFTVDPAYRAKVLKISMDYIVNSGTFVAGTSTTDSDVILYIYDVTNSQLIEPSNIKFLSSSTTISDKVEATFQTSATGSSYRLIVHIATTSASAYELMVDNVTVGPQVYVYGMPLSDWASWTPSGTWVTNTTYTGTKRRIGDSYEYAVNMTLSGAPTATNLSITLPDTIDTTKYPTIANATLGRGMANLGGTYYDLVVVYDTTTSVKVNVWEAGSTYTRSTSPVTATVPGTFANFDRVWLTFNVPIVGLSSSVQMSDSADTRVVSCFKVTGGIPTGTINGGYNAVIWSSVNGDTHNGYSSGSGRYTVKVPGYYRVTATLDINGTFTAGQYIGVRTGNTTTGDYVYNFWKAEASSTSDYPVSVSGTVYAKAGDVLGVDSISSGSSLSFSGSLSGSFFSFDLNQGPSAIAQSEKLYAIYKTGAGQSLGVGVTIVDYDTAEENSHGLVTTGAAWKFTSNRNDLFCVSGAARISTAVRRLDLYKNGAFFRTLCEPSAVDETVGFNTTLRLVAGDYIDVRANGGSAATLYSDNRFNYIIVKT